MTTKRAWQPVRVGGAPDPAGAYSRAVRAGEWLFVSGQVPRDFETGELLGDDIAAQTRGVIENLRRVLRASGSDLGDVVSITAYLADIADWDAFNTAYRAAFEPPFPSRTTVGAALHGVLVEISAVARVAE